MSQDDLAAALNGRQITDDNGEVSEEETFEEESATSEQETQLDESDEVESPDEEEAVPTQDTEQSESKEYAEDETGKKYIPLERFNEVYGKMKAIEREKENLMKLKDPIQKPSGKPVKVDKAEALETELLFQRYPEFDPYSEKYSPILDSLGSKEFQADPSITKLEAARRAITTARNISRSLEGERGKAVAVKREQAEGSITSSGITRTGQAIDPSKMSLDDMEAYLKQAGNW